MTTRDPDEVEGKPYRDATPTGTPTSPVATAGVDESPNWRVPQLEDLERAIKEADAGKIASANDVKAVMKKWGYARRNRREHGWASIIILVALAIVAFLARDALMQYFGLARNAAATAESRLPPAARAPVYPTQASPVITAPVERARSVEGVVQQQADDLAKRIEREAR